MKHVLIAFVFLALICGMFACIASLGKSQTNEGLPLVKSAIRESDEPSPPAWLLLTPCQPNRRNIPTLEERDA